MTISKIDWVMVIGKDFVLNSKKSFSYKNTHSIFLHLATTTATTITELGCGTIKINLVGSLTHSNIFF